MYACACTMVYVCNVLRAAGAMLVGVRVREGYVCACTMVYGCNVLRATGAMLVECVCEKVRECIANRRECVDCLVWLVYHTYSRPAGTNVSRSRSWAHEGYRKNGILPCGITC